MYEKQKIQIGVNGSRKKIKPISIIFRVKLRRGNLKKGFAMIELDWATRRRRRELLWSRLVQKRRASIYTIGIIGSKAITVYRIHANTDTLELYLIMTLSPKLSPKKGRQCKAEREWCTPHQSEDRSPTTPTYRQKEEKGKKSRRL